MGLCFLFLRSASCICTSFNESSGHMSVPLPLFEKEAKKRMSRGGKGVARIPPLEKSKARDDAAKSVGVSARYVESAKAIKKKSPELAREVRDGKSIPQAKKDVWRRRSTFSR